MTKEKQKIWESGYSAGFEAGLSQTRQPKNELVNDPQYRNSHSRDLDEQDVYRKYYPWRGGVTKEEDEHDHYSRYYPWRGYKSSDTR